MRFRLLSCALLAFLGACDPCAGVSACTDAPRFVLIGQIVQPTTANPAPDVQLQVTLTRGPDTLGTQRVTTNADGMWEFRLQAGEELALAHVWVVASPADSFAVPPFEVTTVVQSGDATILEPWYSRPFTYTGLSVVFFPSMKPAVGATVVFEPNGGAARRPGEPTWEGVTNGAGVFTLPMQGTLVGNVVGRMIISHPDAKYTIDIPDYALEVGYRWGFPRVIGTFFFYD